MNLINGYIHLILAILFGILSNSYLKTSENFTNPVPTIFCILTIIVCIYFLSKSMNIIPISFAYATYGGLTITGVTLFGIFKYNQIPNIYGIIGVSMIIIGVILLSTLAKAN